MNLYAMMFGDGNPAAPALVWLLRAKQPLTIDRFRDIWVERTDEGPVIRLHTRLGGGNRADYADTIRSAREHPWYVRDRDLDFDETYADFYFRPGEDLDPDIAQRLEEIAMDPVDVSARWRALTSG